MAKVHSEHQNPGVSAAVPSIVTGEFNPSLRSALISRIRRTLFGVPVDYVLSRADDDDANPRMRFRLMRAAHMAMSSYNLALEASPFALELYLQSLSPEMRSIAIEGILMALFLRDRLRPGQHHVRAFLEGPYACYACFIHVGCGLMIAKGRRSVAPYLRAFSDLACPMVIDGYGFGRMVFDRRMSTTEYSTEVLDPPEKLREAERRVFDNGVGRALVFRLCGKIPAIEETIRKLPRERQLDVWKGVATAMAFNAAPEEVASALREWAASIAFPQIAAGACLASWVRAECNNRTQENDAVAECLVGFDVEMQLAITRAHLPTAVTGSPEQWLAWWDAVGEAFESMTSRSSTPSIPQ